MEKYIVKIEMRKPLSTNEANKMYRTKADMNKPTYARGSVYNFGYTNDIGMAKSFDSYVDAEDYAYSCMFSYWGKETTIAKVVKCEVVIKPIQIYDEQQLSTSDKFSILSIYNKEHLKEYNLNIEFTTEEVENFFKEIEENERYYNYCKKLYESYLKD